MKAVKIPFFSLVLMLVPRKMKTISVAQHKRQSNFNNLGRNNSNFNVVCFAHFFWY